MDAQNEIRRFAGDVANDSTLREELKALGSDESAVIGHVNARGYQFTIEDLRAFTAQGELSDSQLEGVAGGVLYFLMDDQVFCSVSAEGCFNARRPRSGQTHGSFLVW